MEGKELGVEFVDAGKGDRRILLTGYLDSASAGPFMEGISERCSGWSGDDAVLDLSGLAYISSAGIRAIISLHRIVRPGAVSIVGAEGMVREVLEMSGLIAPEDASGDEPEDDGPGDGDLAEIATLKVLADPSLIPRILGFVEELADAYGVGTEDVPRLRLSLEEILVSVFSYGYGNDRRHTADVVVSTGDCVFQASVRDKGLPYDYKTLMSSRAADSANILTHMRSGPSMRNLGREGREQIVRFPRGSCPVGTEAASAPAEPVDFSSIVVHPMRPEEGIQVAQCLYDEFGYTYINDIVYYQDRFEEAVSSGKMISYTAVTPSGEVAGHLTLIRDPHLPGTAELAMGVVRKKFRKGSLMTRLTDAVMEAAEREGLTSVFSHPVGYHPYTQKICVSTGMVPCAVDFNYTCSDMSMSYDTDKRRRHVFMAVQMRRDSHRTVHCPDDALDVVDLVIRGCGLDRTVDTSVRRPLCGETEIETEVNGGLRSGTIYVNRTGEDARESLVRAHGTVKGSMCEVSLLYINMQDPGIHSMYDAARSIGYFVTGMFPGSSDHDWLIMHNPFYGGVDYGAFVTERPFAELLDAVRRHDPEDTT